jgi:hypothetical protein
MPSRSLALWQTQARSQLDEVERDHSALGGKGRGRRYATLQINHAYTVLLASQFQKICRDLHTEAADRIVGAVPDVAMRIIFKEALTRQRKLDHGNAGPSALGDDFSRVGITFLDAVKANRPENVGRLRPLEELILWRNAIAHQDFSRLPPAAPPFLRLGRVRRWRACCNALAEEFDHVIGAYLSTLAGVVPW